MSLTIHTTSFDQDGDSKGGSDEDQDDLAIATPDDTALPSIPLRDDNVTTHKNDSEGNRESVPAIKHENDNSEHLKPNECNDTELENDTHTAHNGNLKSKEHILPKQENYVEANKSTHTDVGDAEVENQNAGSETTLTHYTDENENRTKDAQMYNKDRRVTFSQENNMNERAEEITEEGFAKEYEYRPHDKRRGKFFEELDDYERFKYFKSEYHMPSEQIRELTFRPKVNETKIIHQTYTGVDVNEWRESPNHARAESERLLKSRLRNHERKVSITPSYQRKDFMLSQFQGIVYHQMKDVYGKSPRDYTEKRFYNRLSQVQKDESERRSQMLQDKERRRRESTIRQTHQLRQVRDKYELGAMRRFMTQFVASKVTESHPANRKDFGLPETLDLQKRKASLKIYSPDLKDNANNRKVSLKPHSPDSVKDKVNKKKFDTLFKMTPRPIWRTDEDIKFEGYDSVLLDTEDENGRPSQSFIIVSLYYI